MKVQRSHSQYKSEVVVVVVGPVEPVAAAALLAKYAVGLVVILGLYFFVCRPAGIVVVGVECASVDPGLGLVGGIHAGVVVVGSQEEEEPSGRRMLSVSNFVAGVVVGEGWKSDWTA